MKPTVASVILKMFHIAAFIPDRSRGVVQWEHWTDCTGRLSGAKVTYVAGLGLNIYLKYFNFTIFVFFLLLWLKLQSKCLEYTTLTRIHF